MKLGASVWELPPGQAAYPYHFHLGDTAVSFVAVSNQQPDICVQPDSGKVGAFERRPDGGGMRLWFREGDAAGYWEGEEPPGSMGIRPLK